MVAPWRASTPNVPAPFSTFDRINADDAQAISPSSVILTCDGKEGGFQKDPTSAFKILSGPRQRAKKVPNVSSNCSYLWDRGRAARDLRDSGDGPHVEPDGDRDVWLQYSVTATGNSDPKHVRQSSLITFTVTSNGQYLITRQRPLQHHHRRPTVTSAADDFRTIATPGDLNTRYRFFSKAPERDPDTSDGSPTETVRTPIAVRRCFAATTPPPPGKTFAIGPSSMEGHLLIRPGDWISEAIASCSPTAAILPDGHRQQHTHAALQMRRRNDRTVRHQSGHARLRCPGGR